MGFRKDFLWGGAVAAHQLEGAYEPDKSKTLRFHDRLRKRRNKTYNRLLRLRHTVVRNAFGKFCEIRRISHLRQQYDVIRRIFGYRHSGATYP